MTSPQGEGPSWCLRPGLHPPPLLPLITEWVHLLHPLLTLIKDLYVIITHVTIVKILYVVV